MSKLTVINSFGPMGSTLLASLVEKLGFTNVPLRKLRLHDYLMGDLSLDSGVMQGRLENILTEHSKPALVGGVSVLDRNNQAPKSLTDIKRVEGALADFKNKKFDNIQALYDGCRQIYNDAVIYKKIETTPDCHIEMTVDIHRFDPDKLYQAYQDNFDEVHMIHLHRDFSGWINALSSQAFTHPDLLHRVKFFPHMRYADYALYEDSVNAMPGLHVQFDEMFDTPIEALAEKTASTLNVPIPEMNLRKEKYDLYGKTLDYDFAFKRFDDSVSYLQPKTLKYLSKLAETGAMASNLPAQILSWLRYLMDMLRYRRKQRT